jgi:hypothetical protein
MSDSEITKENYSYKTTAIVIGAFVTVLIWGIAIGICFQRINYLDNDASVAKVKFDKLEQVVLEGMKMRIQLQGEVANINTRLDENNIKLDNNNTKLDELTKALNKFLYDRKAFIWPDDNKQENIN